MEGRGLMLLRLLPSLQMVLAGSPSQAPLTPPQYRSCSVTGNSPGSPLLMFLVYRQMERKLGSEYRAVSWISLLHSRTQLSASSLCTSDWMAWLIITDHTLPLLQLTPRIRMANPSFFLFCLTPGPPLAFQR